MEPLQRLAGAVVGRLNAADRRQDSVASDLGEPDLGQYGGTDGGISSSTVQ